MDAASELKEDDAGCPERLHLLPGVNAACEQAFKQLTGTATINGVGFYDRPHAIGHAPFGVEIHPVLFFASSDCPQG